MITHLAKQLHHTILDAKNIILVPHKKPDGDALGAATAAYSWLNELGKTVHIFTESSIDSHLQYLLSPTTVTAEQAIWNSADLVIVFDSGDLVYAGVDRYIASATQRPYIVNIDHHSSNEFFGNLNLVDKTSASTTELLYRFFRINNVAISPTMATSLMTGLISDTDNFTNAATSEMSLAVGSHLIDLGADFSQIKDHLYKKTPLSLLKLWGEVFQRMTHHPKHDIVYSYITNEDLKKYQIQSDQLGGLSNFLNNLAEGKAGMLLHEQADNTVKGSLRTTRDDLDLTTIALALGGGGHQKAAGFVLNHASVHEAIDQIFNTIDSLTARKALSLARS